MKDIDVYDRWWVATPDSEKIEVISETTGKVICSIEISDYQTLKEAQRMAQIIASLPELLTPTMLARLMKNFSLL
jgi:hypothetical protein